MNNLEQWLEQDATQMKVHLLLETSLKWIYNNAASHNRFVSSQKMSLHQGHCPRCSKH